MRSIIALRIPRPAQRTIAFFIALSLQLAFLLLLIQAIEFATPVRNVLSRELTLILPRIAPAMPSTEQAPRESGIKSTIRPEVSPPEAVSPAPQMIPFIPPSALQGFGQALNNCAPETYANLPDDQKANCTRPGAGIAVQQAPSLSGVPSEVKDNDYWASQLAARKTPMRIDCTHLETMGLGGGQEATSIFVDPLCALKEVQRHTEH